MQYFLNLLKKILLAEWEFFPPKNKKILIFDKTWSNLLLKIFKKNQINILHTRGEKVNLYIVLVCLAKGLFRPGDYYMQYIKETNPKMIITFIDNSPLFWRLNKITNIKTIFIQNGVRAHFRDVFGNKKLVSKKNNYKVNLMFVFNSYCGKRYNSFIKGKYISIGSFKSNVIKVSKKNKKKEIAFISTFRPLDNSKIVSHDISWGYYNKNHIFFMEWVKRYCKKNKIRINIFGKNTSRKGKDIEENYYKNIFFDSDFTFVRLPLRGPTYKAHEPTYRALDKFKYVFTPDSTLGIENLSRNGRTGFIGNMPNKYPINTIKFGWNENFKSKGPFWTNQNKYSEFKRVFDFVINGSESKWKKVRKKFVPKVMPYDYENKIFKREIKKYMINL